jgi:RNA polymerase sigma-70 factor (ECF subfamily)
MDKTKADEKHDLTALLEKVKSGDREAFMTTIGLYQRKVFLLAFSFFQNKEDALDIVQETFLRLYQKIGQYERGKSFPNWLMQIARNICIDYYRQNYSRRKDLESSRSLEDIDPAANDPNPEEASDLKAVFSSCLSRLGERQRAVFIMKHYNGLQYNEIAPILQISIGTVKSLHFKAIQKMRKLVAPHLGAET